jgi:hypothetical protein
LAIVAVLWLKSYRMELRLIGVESRGLAEGKMGEAVCFKTAKNLRLI